MRSSSRLGALISVRTLWSFTCPMFLVTAFPASSWALLSKGRCQALKQSNSLHSTRILAVGHMQTFRNILQGSKGCPHLLSHAELALEGFKVPALFCLIMLALQSRSGVFVCLQTENVQTFLSHCMNRSYGLASHNGA